MTVADSSSSLPATTYSLLNLKIGSTNTADLLRLDLMTCWRHHKLYIKNEIRCNKHDIATTLLFMSSARMTFSCNTMNVTTWGLTTTAPEYKLKSKHLWVVSPHFLWRFSPYLLRFAHCCNRKPSRMGLQAITIRSCNRPCMDLNAEKLSTIEWVLTRCRTK